MIYQKKVYQKSEQCWCGSSMSIESFTEATVLEECEQFRREHRHKEADQMGTVRQEADQMVAKEFGTLSIPVYVGTPTRVDFQYALLVNHDRMLVRDGFDWKICDDGEQPTTWEFYDDAEKARRKAELIYEKLCVPAEVTVTARSVRTYVDSWSYHPKQELGPLT